MIIAITGKFGCGKSTIAKVFKENGYLVIDADKIGHSILNQKEIKKQLIQSFGKTILNKTKIDRKKLGDIVFFDIKKLKKLSSVTHPLIVSEIIKIIKTSKNKNIVIDSALFTDTLKQFIDKTIVVITTRENTIRRHKHRYSEQKLKNILNLQSNYKDKIKQADFIINNNVRPYISKKQTQFIIDDLRKATNLLRNRNSKIMW